MSSNGFWVLIGRALRQRCPVCGKGKIFAGLFKTYERCPNCNFYYEREEGYYTGAIAINLALSELLIVCIAVPIAASQSISNTVSIPELTALGLVLTILLPLVFFRPTKALWMSFDHFIHPTDEGF